MDAMMPEPASRTHHDADRGLLLLVAGAVILVIVGLISLPLLQRRTPTLAPAGTPEGTVQRFYQAAYENNYAAAHELLSSNVRDQISVGELQQQLSRELRNSQARVGAATMHDTTVTVEVVLTHFGAGGLFGSSEWTERRDVLLRREGDRWTIESGAFYLPPGPVR